MTKLRITFFCLLLALAGIRAEAALSDGEKKAFDLADTSFRFKMWERADAQFDAFIKDFPKSEKIAEAVLYQAQAQYEQKKYAQVVALLQPREGAAGNLADQFLYWIGKAQFEAADYTGAAATFGKLVRAFPTSPKRLDAAVSEAASLAKLGNWTNVVKLLQRPDGAFRLSALTEQGSELVARGYLLQAEGQLALKLYPDAEDTLKKISAGLTGELEWQRRFLLCRTLVAQGRPNEAAEESAGMIVAAEGTRQWELLSDSVVFRADLLEQLGQLDEAKATLRLNLNLTNAPVARQRQALLRITALALQQDQLDEATSTLELFLTQYTNAAAADVASLTLGELHLKQHVGKLGTGGNTNGVVTNRLAEATNCFHRVLRGFPGSAYVGKAQLNLGWCYWVESNFVASEGAFDAAVKRFLLAKTPPEDLAVAQFKLADAQFAQGNYPAALVNYRAVLPVLTNWPAVNGALRTPASYQVLRTSLALTNATGAEEAMREILRDDSASEEAISSVLLVAQAYLDANQPAEAQRLFSTFVRLFPESDLQPEVELLVARMREEQGDWSGVAVAYDDWLGRYGTNWLRPQVEFQRALAAGVAGETNALRRFTNFVARYPTNELAPRAQWWVADYHFAREEWAAAELNYKLVFQNWKTFELAYEARMMAGRAAMGRYVYKDAIEHFTSFTSDTNCPVELRVRGLFAYGGALMLWAPSPATTNKLETWNKARQVFSAIVENYPTNELVAAACGEIGNCALNMGATDPAYYNVASNFYQQAMTFPTASVTIRSQAKVGLAVVLEKQAQQASGEVQLSLLKQARDHVFDLYVELGTHPRANEPAVGFWRKEAGKEAARLDESLQEWPQALALYRDMLRQKMLPTETLERKISNAEKQLRADKKID